MFSATSLRARRARNASRSPKVMLLAAVLVAGGIPTVAFLTPASAAACTVAAAGDIATSNNDSESTAKLIESIKPTAVITMGDNAYESGTAEEYKNYYDPTWGRFKNITKPSPGNHEYNSGGEGYFAYFGVKPYYAYDICGWHALSLNSETDIEAQTAFIASEGQKAAGRPIIAYWHQPRYSSSDHGSNEAMQPLFEASIKAGAKIILNGHDHVYERFSPMDASGKANKAGAVEMVIGTGGAPGYEFKTTMPNSVKRINNTTGVGLFSLAPNGYAFEFRESSGTVGDKTSATFAAAPGAGAVANTGAGVGTGNVAGIPAASGGAAGTTTGGVGAVRNPAVQTGGVVAPTMQNPPLATARPPAQTYAAPTVRQPLARGRIIPAQPAQMQAQYPAGYNSGAQQVWGYSP